MARSAKNRTACACLLAIVLLAAATLFAEPIASLTPANYVNDFAGVLDSATQAKLNALCYEVEQKAGAQMAVVTVKSTDGQEVFDYAVALYQKWGIGKKGNDRGVLILLAAGDHKYFTSVGYGLEPILPDGKVGGFGREMVPLLRAGDYNGAVTQITTQIAAVIAQDRGVTLTNQPRIAQRPRGRQGNTPGALVALAIFVIVMIVFAVMSGISRGGPRGGGGSGFFSGLLWGMLLDNVTRPRGYGGWSGGGFGGGGFGGGGFGGGGGGFGGFGGGSTGGGGAGGSW